MTSYRAALFVVPFVACGLAAAPALAQAAALPPALQPPPPAADACPGEAAAASAPATVRALFDAARKDDEASFRKITTDSFYAYDGGKKFTGEALLDVVKAAHRRGDIYIWNVTEPQTMADCKLALVTWVNQGSVAKQGKPAEKVTWLESATLSFEHGTWRVAFLHSTRAAP